MTVYCATGNPGKLREFQRAAERFSPGHWRLETVPGLSAMEPCEETGKTFEENAVLKALYYARDTRGYTFADDSGLEVDALGGAPGVYSARYAGPNATDDANNALVLEKMRGVAERSARFVCVIALARDGELVRTFHGTVEGVLLEEAHGEGGFGYDPLFYYPPYGCTLAEVDGDRKLNVSHRGKALAEMFRYLQAETR